MIKQTLLTAGNAKIIKGEALGYITKGLHFAPANLSGFEVCRGRSKGCTASCLYTAGRGAMQRTKDSRVAKTKLFFEQRFDFFTKLSKEIVSTIKSSIKKEMQAVFRLNLTSDILGKVNSMKMDKVFLRNIAQLNFTITQSDSTE